MLDDVSEGGSASVIMCKKREFLLGHVRQSLDICVVLSKGQVGVKPVLILLVIAGADRITKVCII
jgi:hypothetical protein